ncbi:hypothetical protein D3C75_498270 [compost metagenome]
MLSVVEFADELGVALSFPALSGVALFELFELPQAVVPTAEISISVRSSEALLFVSFIFK